MQKDYAARNAALNQEAAALNQKSQAIAAEIGELKANTIRADGLYVVGHESTRVPGTPPAAASPAVGLPFLRVGSASKSNTLPGPAL